MSNTDNRDPGSAAPIAVEPADPRVGRISETHEEELKRKSQDYSERALMDEDGSGPVDIGMAVTGVAAAAMSQNNAESRKEKEKRERFRELLRLLEDRINWLGGEIGRLDEEIEQAEQEVATMESLMEAVRSGRELTPDEEILAERYRDENGEIDMERLEADTEKKKFRLHELKGERDAYQAEMDGLKERKAALEERIYSGEELEPRDVELAVELGAGPQGGLMEEYANNDEAFGFDLESKLADFDAQMGSHASTISATTIEAESVKSRFNASASGETPIRLDEEYVTAPNAGFALKT